MTTQLTKDLGKVLSPYIQHQGSSLFIYGTQPYRVYVLCVQSFDAMRNLVSQNPLHKRRVDLGDHPRTTACQALTDYLAPYLTYKTKSMLLQAGLPEFWDGSTGTTYYAIHGAALDEHALAKAIHQYNASKEAMEARLQLAWVNFRDLDSTRMPDHLVAFLRSQRPTRWDVSTSSA